MTEPKQLDRTDVMYIGGETPEVYQHTAGLLILDSGGRKRFGFEKVKKHLAQRVEQVPQFRWKLHQVPMGLDLPYWVEDEDFKLEHHIKRIAVPAPGDREALAEVVAHLYSQHMDRSKPLWEFWYIEGLEGGKSALLQKIHHCMMDGSAFITIGNILFDPSPRARPHASVGGFPEAKAGAVPEPRQVREITTRKLVRLPLEIYRGLDELLRPKLLAQLSWRRDKAAAHPPVPRAPFNAAIGRERGLVFASLPLDTLKAVKQAFGVSLNDVVLALVGTALRNYLLHHDCLPQDSLRAIIAISLRQAGDDELGNRVTNKPITLATDSDDLEARLQAIHDESRLAIEQARQGSGKNLVDVIQHLPPLLVNAIVQVASADQAPALLGANLAVSNVRGSPRPMYLAGAKVAAMYPMSLIGQGLGINITCVSYANNMEFGLTLAPDLFPDPWDIADGLQLALSEYRHLAET